MYAESAVMFTTPKKAIQTAESLPEPLLKLFLKTVYARFAE